MKSLSLSAYITHKETKMNEIKVINNKTLSINLFIKVIDKNLEDLCIYDVVQPETFILNRFLSDNLRHKKESREYYSFYFSNEILKSIKRITNSNYFHRMMEVYISSEHSQKVSVRNIETNRNDLIIEDGFLRQISFTITLADEIDSPDDDLINFLLTERLSEIDPDKIEILNLDLFLGKSSYSIDYKIKLIGTFTPEEIQNKLGFKHTILNIEYQKNKVYLNGKTYLR